MSFNFDRRTFLKGAGAVGAASLLAACGEKSNNTGNGAAASGAAAPNSTGATFIFVISKSFAPNCFL